MKHVLAAVVAVALVWSFLPKMVPPAVVTPKSPVAAALDSASQQDRERVAAFYSAFADVLEREPGAAKTAGLFRELHARSLDIAFRGTDLPGKYPGLDVAINDRLVAAVGKDDIPLPPERMRLLIQALKEVSNAAR